MNKISSKKETVGYAYSPTIHIEFEKLNALKELVLGDQVRVVISGKVKSLEQREDYDDPKIKHATMCIRDFTATLVKGTSQFDELMEEEDE